MKKILFLLAFPLMNLVYADPGILIEIDIIFERPSGSGEGTLG